MNVAVITAVFALAFNFASCNQEDEPETPEYYHDCNCDYEIVALRNVTMKWTLSWDIRDFNDTYHHFGNSDGEFMACAGRSLLKADGDMDGNWNHYIISKLDDPTAFYFYSLNKHEYYVYAWGATGDKINASYAQLLEIYDIFSNAVDVEYLFMRAKKSNMTNGVWNDPVSETFGSITVTGWYEYVSDKQIADINCKGFCYIQRTVNSASGTDVTQTYYTAYYDPATELTMSYEEDFDAIVNFGAEHVNKKYEITQIEYNTTKKEDVDNILNAYLEDNNPTDVTNEEYPGEGW